MGRAPKEKEKEMEKGKDLKEGKGKGSKGKGKGKGKGGKGGAKGGAKVAVIPHRHPGVFVAKGKDDAIVTKNMDPGNSVYGEKRISVEEGEQKIEYRVWNPFRSKLCAAVVAGVEDIHVCPGARVLYLGAASGTTVSHCSDVVGPEGLVYAVEFSARPARDLINCAKKRTNIIPIKEDARHPLKYPCSSAWWTSSSLMSPSPTRLVSWDTTPSTSSRTEATSSSQSRPTVSTVRKPQRPCSRPRSTSLRRWTSNRAST